jgi:hypothetical protein
MVYSGCSPTWSFNLTWVQGSGSTLNLTNFDDHFFLILLYSNIHAVSTLLYCSYRYGAGHYYIGHWNTECDLGRFSDGLQFSTSRRYRLCEITGHADKQRRPWNLDSDRKRV